MKDLLIKAQGLVDDLNSELAQAREKTAEANQTSAAARIVKNQLDVKLLDVEKREQALASSEKPGKQLEEASRIKAENAKLATEVYEAKDKLEKERSSFRSEMAAAKASIKKDQEELANTRENFRVKADALGAREKKFEAKLKELGLKVA